MISWNLTNKIGDLLCFNEDSIGSPWTSPNFGEPGHRLGPIGLGSLEAPILCMCVFYIYIYINCIYIILYILYIILYIYTLTYTWWILGIQLRYEPRPVGSGAPSGLFWNCTSGVSIVMVPNSWMVTISMGKSQSNSWMIFFGYPMT